MLDLAKREKMSFLVLKVDYEKAYDCVTWNYLRVLFIRIGFGDNWISWIEVCVFSNSMSVLVNYNTIEDFKVERRLHQGDPLSPFLFVIAMEGLTGLMESIVELGEGFKINEDESVDIL